MPSRETVLITGASTGIGFELARCFARDGYTLVLNSRHRDRLREAAQKIEAEFNCKVTALAVDLSKPDGPEKLFREAQGLQIDILINNAGVGVVGFFHQTQLEHELEMIQLNVTSLTQLTKLFLDGMIKRKRGRIMHVASTAAFQPGPLMAVYFATKAYVHSFSQATRNELRGTGVKTSLFCPGPTQTNFWQTTGMNGNSKLYKAARMSAEKAARIGYRGFLKNKAVIVPGIMNKILLLGAKFLPEILSIWSVRIIQDLKLQWLKKDRKK